MYDAFDDPYCYPGTSILRNLQDLRDQAVLDRFETAITAQRAQEPLPAGRLSYRHYLAIHRHLFQDVYDWAGRIRTIRVGKGGNWFAYPEYIDAEMRKLFGSLKSERCLRGLSEKEFASKAASFLAHLNAIHPFREGNGRTQLTFLLVPAHGAGHPLLLERLEPASVLDAMIKSFGGNEKPLETIIFDLIQPSG